MEKENTDQLSEADVMDMLEIPSDVFENVEFTENNTSVISNNKSYTSRKHVMDGSFKIYLFNLEFETRQKKSKSDGCNLEVVDLKLNVEDHVYEDLSQSLQLIVNHYNVLGFFILMSTYASWRIKIEKIFNSFEEKYPGIAEVKSLKDNKCILQILVDGHSDFIFIIWYSWLVDESFHTTPEVKLGVKVSESLLKEDDSSCIRASPRIFRKMLENYDIEHSINTLINMINPK
ncbi:hypothetical protein SNE40_015051 [Patella caerulea]|uniref:Uncharacterized protein n=1 Tax=Patella caerulea TaxID=87958 RepID=A0AAN8JJ55_PATCE